MQQTNAAPGGASNSVKLVAAWLLVGIPLAWGIFNTAVNASALFK
jgi:hypothetical protein